MIRVDALLVVDVQRALVMGDHAVPEAAAFLDRLAAVLAAARGGGATVIHLQDHGDRLITHGTDPWHLALPAFEGEVVLEKPHDDGFEGTDLEAVLRESGAHRICVVGIQSEMCVAATARTAMARGFTVVLPRDGHTTYDVPADGAAPAVPAALVSRVAEWSLGDEVIAPDRAADVAFGRIEA
ncbi:isochorismatase family protein [Nocardioides sp.]|uniref:isochorismatase family protein n=1 Tax=Nocardioides sp. TaxID=35761 RepID=UPI002ED66AE7